MYFVLFKLHTSQFYSRNQLEKCSLWKFVHKAVLGKRTFYQKEFYHKVLLKKGRNNKINYRKGKLERGIFLYFPLRMCLFCASFYQV